MLNWKIMCYVCARRARILGLWLHYESSARAKRSLAVVNLGERERCSGLALVALSRVKRLEHMLIAPMPFSRLSSIGKSPGFALQLKELAALDAMDRRTRAKYNV